MLNNILAFLITISSFISSKKEEVVINVHADSNHISLPSSFNQYMSNKAYSDMYSESLAPVLEVSKKVKGGSFGKVSVHDRWVKKEDKRDDVPPTIQREWEVLTLLQGTGLVPVVKKEYPTAGKALYVEHIASNTLEEVIDEYLVSNVSSDAMIEILSQVTLTLKAFYAVGWVHNDLHGRNLLISASGSGYKITIIDVAFSTSTMAPATVDMLEGKYLGLGQESSIKLDLERFECFTMARVGWILEGSTDDSRTRVSIITDYFKSLRVELCPST